MFVSLANCSSNLLRLLHGLSLWALKCFLLQVTMYNKMENLANLWCFRACSNFLSNKVVTRYKFPYRICSYDISSRSICKSAYSYYRVYIIASYIAMWLHFGKLTKLSHRAYSILLARLMATLKLYPFTVTLPGLPNWSAFLVQVLPNM